MEGLFAWSTDKGYGMPACCFVSVCSSFSLHSLLCISPFSLPFLFLTLESYSSVPFLLACFVLARCATRGLLDDRQGHPYYRRFTLHLREVALGAAP